LKRGAGGSQQLTALSELLVAMAAAEKPVVANAMESIGQNMKEKAPDELFGREAHVDLRQREK
jgi:hypothetical protein